MDLNNSPEFRSSNQNAVQHSCLVPSGPHLSKLTGALLCNAQNQRTSDNCNVNMANQSKLNF